MNDERTNPRALRALFGFVGISAMLLCLGCGKSSGRQAIQGTVTLDGSPLESGTISFFPKPGTTSPSAGSAISQGEFHIAAESGLLPGTFRVEITARRATGEKRYDDVMGKEYDVVEQFLPPQYNKNSELQTEVKAGEPVDLEFTLLSS